MTFILALWTLVCTALLIRSYSDIVSLVRNIWWLSEYAKRIHNTSRPSTRFVVCIPALYEQKIITATLDKMLAIHYPKDLVDIYVVTTSREEKHGQELTTNELLQEYRKTLPEGDRQRLYIIDLPNKKGRMAHQINYAAKLASSTLQDDSAYFVIYNADSDINPETFQVAHDTIENIRHAKTQPPLLLQQSAIYTHSTTSSWIESSITKGAAMHQSRWTLVHELTRLRNQSRHINMLNGTSVINSIRHARVAHCVGHGLFVQGRHYLENPLPIDTLNEDLPYGLIQSVKRHSIYPIPILELASSPSRIINLYKQKTVWFNPFFEFYGCAKKILANGTYSNKFEVYFLTMQAWISMAIWLIHSFMWAAGLALSIALGWRYILIWLLIFALYWIIPGLLYHMYTRRAGLYSCLSLSSLLLGSLYVLTHSTGPIICCYKWAKASITGMQIDKPKTISD